MLECFSWLRRILESTKWSIFITSIILLNALTLGLDTIQPISARFGAVFSSVDSVCLVIFVVEILARIMAYGFRFFIGKESGWNWFDFIIVIVSVMAGNGVSVLRALCVIRVFRLLSVIPSMRLISTAMLHTLPSMLGILALLVVFYYTYGVLCVNLFGEKFPDWFGSLGESFYTLFQIMTLESWSMGIVRPVMAEYHWAWAVFVSFICITNFIVLNLIVGVVVESIAEIKKRK